MAIQLAVSSYSLARWRRQNDKTVEQSIDVIAELGAKGVEFAGLGENTIENPLRRAAELRKYCQGKGLAVAGYCVGAELMVPPEDQKKAVQTLKVHVDTAVELGAKTMRHDVTKGPKPGEDLSLGQVLERVVPAVREVTEYAAKKGVKTSLENHGFYLQTAERVEKLIQAVNHPNYGLTLDMGNFLCLDQDPVDAVGRLVKYAVIVHAKDFHKRLKNTMPASGWFATPTEIALRGAIVGHGVIDVPAQLRILKEAGYSGYLSLEFEGMEEPATGVKLGIEYLRAQLTLLGMA